MAKEIDTTNKVYDVILYTDGASSPNPGYSGSGVTGYIYAQEDIDKKTSDKPNNISITDQGYINGSIDNMLDIHYVKPTWYVDGIYVFHNVATNNVAELQAIVYGLENILNLDMSIGKILIKSDSEYAIGVFNTVLVNPNTSWDNNTANVEYYHSFNKLFKICKDRGIEVNTLKVKGHDLSWGNNIADRLAVTARIVEAESKLDPTSFVLTEAKKFWDSQLIRHPFLKYRQMFFLNSNSPSTKPVYSIMSYDSKLALGQKAPDPLFGTFMPTIPITEIEDVKSIFTIGAKDSYMALGTIDLDVLYKQRTSHYYKLFGNTIFHMNNKHTQLLALDEDSVAYIITPAGLPVKSIEEMQIHQRIILDYLGIDKTMSNSYIDVTPTFYKVNAKGRTECALANGTNKITVDISYNGKDISLPLQLGSDLPDRNKLKNLEANNMSVIFVIEPVSDVLFNYYIVLEDGSNKDISCWCNFYTNKYLLAPDEVKSKKDK